MHLVITCHDRFYFFSDLEHGYKRCGNVVHCYIFAHEVGACSETNSEVITHSKMLFIPIHSIDVSIKGVPQMI